jgi:hypothetical protein
LRHFSNRSTDRLAGNFVWVRSCYTYTKPPEDGRTKVARRYVVDIPKGVGTTTFDARYRQCLRQVCRTRSKVLTPKTLAASIRLRSAVLCIDIGSTRPGASRLPAVVSYTVGALGPLYQEERVRGRYLPTYLSSSVEVLTPFDHRRKTSD